MPQETPTVRHGSCLCETVKFEVRGDPITFRVCHCINCRKTTGSAFMSNGFFVRDRVRVLEGQESLKVFRDERTKSGVPLDRVFCGLCGSNVFLSTADAENSQKFIMVALGTLDHEIDWIPKSEVFPEQKRSWVTGIHSRTKQKL